jgi:acyl-CoA thioesterase I
MKLRPTDHLLFLGDSITDCGRQRADPSSLGSGYVAMIAARLRAAIASPQMGFRNIGVSGNRVYDLEARIETEALPFRPTVSTVLIGINDVWRRYDRGLSSQVDEFRASYRRMLGSLREATGCQLILMEPFLLPVPDDRRQWREDLDPKLAIVRELAVEFGAALVPLDGLFAEAATRAPAAFWLPDGVHPSDAGHALIAEAWLQRFGGASGLP